MKAQILVNPGNQKIEKKITQILENISQNSFQAENSNRAQFKHLKYLHQTTFITLIYLQQIMI